MNKAHKRVCIAAIAGAHGVKGDMLVKYFTQAPENIAAYGPVETEDGARHFTLKYLRQTKPGLAIARAAEIANREDAKALKGVRLYVDRAALPDTQEDEFYLEDLIGLVAIDETGAPAGRVAAVHNFGAGDLIELADIPDTPGARIIAFTKDAVPAIDLAAGRLTISRAALEDADAASIRDEAGETVDDEVAAMRGKDA